MIGVIEIATATVTALAPYVPYLLKGVKAAGGKFAEGMATKGGELAGGQISEIWDKIKKHFGEHPELEHAAGLVAAGPADPTYQTVFAKALATYLGKNPQLSEDLLKLLGGEQGVQKVIADRSSTVEDVTQEIEGSGTQSVEATDNSTVRGVRQIRKK